MNKAAWKARALEAEAEVSRLQGVLLAAPPLTFDNLSICWSNRSVTWKGREILLGDGPDCITFPITNNMHLLDRAGWSPR